jgi:hypothetical protein
MQSRSSTLSHGHNRIALRELKRIVVATPERCLGRRILEELISVAFDQIPDPVSLFPVP